MIDLAKSYRGESIQLANIDYEDNELLNALNLYLEKMTEPNFIVYAEPTDFGVNDIVILTYEYLQYSIDLQHSYDIDRIIATQLNVWIDITGCTNSNYAYNFDDESLAVVYGGEDNGVLREILGEMKSSLYRSTPLYKDWAEVDNG